MAKTALGYLSEEATRLALAQPITTGGATITAGALAAAARATRGYPYFVQLYGYHCWRLAGGGAINETHLEFAAEAVTADVAANLYQPRLAQLSPLERAYLRLSPSTGNASSPPPTRRAPLHVAPGNYPAPETRSSSSTTSSSSSNPGRCRSPCPVSHSGCAAPWRWSSHLCGKASARHRPRHQR
ncbi:MAG: hypothetical protein ACRDZ8_07655 [Acidimicrobiales bacterium]